MVGKNVSKWVQEQPDKLVECLATSDPALAIGELCRDQIGRLTFQRSPAIEGILRDVAKCDPPWAKAAKTLSSVESVWTEEDVKGRLDEYVERRNRIVHGGDLTDSGTTKAIQLSYVTTAARVIEAVGEAVNAVVRERVRHAYR
jgi:hypothetical protein